MFESVLSNVTGTLSVGVSIECIVAAIILGLIIACVHMYTSNYSKNFVVSLAILPILVQVVIMMVNGNLGTSVAVLGAFSLIKFRSIPGNSKEITSVFFAMAIGLALGMGHILFATFITIIVSILLILFYRIGFGKNKKEQKRLKIVVPEDLDYTVIFNDIMVEYTDKNIVEKVRKINMGSMYEITYVVTIKDEKKEKEFLDKIRIINANLNVSLCKLEEGVNEL